MQVVRGVHPQYVVQHGPDLAEELTGLFAPMFGPFGAWQSRRMAIPRGLRDAAAVLLGLVASLRLQMQLYAPMQTSRGKWCGRASSSWTSGGISSAACRGGARNQADSTN